MLTSALHDTAALTQGISIEVGLLGFAAFTVVVLLIVRMKRSHDQKIRRAAGAGFYDFDVARFGTASSSLMENTVASSARPLAPSFVAPGRAATHKEARVAAPGPTHAPMAVPSSFGVVDRSPTGPLPAFDQGEAAGRRPPSSPTGQRGPHLPIPATPYLAPPPPPSMSSLPPLVQPPPPSPGSEQPADDTPT